jgi:Fe-S-cluster containining protein
MLAPGDLPKADAALEPQSVRARIHTMTHHDPDENIRTLPVIESCDGCGACCLVVSRPPFYRVFDEAGEEAWERLKWDRPDLHAEFLADSRARRANGGPYFGTPCIWYDPESRRCRHYDHRPRACREFAIASVDCRDARRRAGEV